ncbi:MAG TPA: UMP kinase [Planctomycetes bacterium]|nr:UMP kinase [Planctomycetota bacterium]
MRTCLLKLSGEALGGGGGTGLDGGVLGRIADEIASAAEPGLGIGIVAGAGNFVRGAALEAVGIPRQRGDFMGMIATVLNGMALGAALETRGVRTRLLSGIPIGDIVPGVSEDALACPGGEVVILAGGTGNPFFTTDTAAALRAAQMGAGVLLKATKVDGVFSADPVRDPGAERFSRLSYREVLRRRLQVMDLTAITLCMERRIPIRVFNMHVPGNLAAALRGGDVGTLVTE